MKNKQAFGATIKQTFPPQLCVTQQNDGEDHWWNVSEDLQARDVEDGAPVAIYRLEMIKTKKVTHELVVAATEGTK